MFYIEVDVLEVDQMGRPPSIDMQAIRVSLLSILVQVRDGGREREREREGGGEKEREGGERERKRDGYYEHR
jgi:hypothetical protein